MIDPKPNRILLFLLGAEIVNAAYLASTDAATLFYHANVFLHVAVGIPLTIWILWRGWRVLTSGAGAGFPGATTWPRESMLAVPER